MKGSGLAKGAALGCTLCWLTSAQATTEGEWHNILNALDHIPSAVGISVRGRIENCHIKIQRGTSLIDTRQTALPALGARPGEEILQIAIDVPPLPGDDASIYKDLSATWIVSDGHARPANGWANWLQNKPQPIGSDVWMNC